MTLIPLVRLLTDAGYGSRRESSKLVKAGLVQVNGNIASSYTEKVDAEVDSIVVTGIQVPSGTTHRVYIVLNKPEGYLSTTEDDRDRPTVLDLLPQHLRLAGLHPAGRLDEDSTGLLVLTNDGQLTYELTHPRFEHEKEYWVATTGRLTDADVERLEKGVEIEEQMTWPARLKLLLGQSPYTYSITIHEGRKRQVRMMFAAIGQQVAMLRRVRLGGLLLGDLKEGEWRELTPPELKDLMRKRPPERRATGSDDRTRQPLERRGNTDERRATAPAYTVDRPPRVRSPYTERTALRTGTRRETPIGPRGEQPVYRRRETVDTNERPYRQPAQTRSERPYTQGESAPATERPYRRSTDDRGPRTFEQRESYGPPERRESRPAPGRDARPYARRDSGASPERPYRRPTDDRGPGTAGHRESFTTSDRRERRPAQDGGAGTYARRPSPPSPRRPMHRGADAPPAAREPHRHPRAFRE